MSVARLPSISLHEIRRASSGKGADVWFLKLLRKGFGYYAAHVCLRLGILPLQVSFFNFFLANAVCLMFAWLGPEGRVWAALLLVLWQAMDTVDGNMARALKIRSNYGGFIDFIGGMFVLAYVQLSIGIGLLRYPDYSLGSLLEGSGFSGSCPPEVSLILAAYGGVSTVLCRLVHRMVQIRFRQEMFDEDSGQFGNLGRAGKLLKLMRNIENLGSVQIPAIFLGTVAGGLEIVVACYFLVNTVMLAGYTARIFIRLRHSHDYLRD